MNEPGFFRAILENPGDNSVRLIFADYIDEQGHEQRAEFIRVQCQAHDLQKAGGDLHRLRRVLNRAQRLDEMRKNLILETQDRYVWCEELRGVFPEDGRGVVWRFTRGFPGDFSLPLWAFQDYPQLFLAAPVEAVDLTDRRPRYCWDNDNWSYTDPNSDEWDDCSPHILPAVIASLCSGGWTTEAAARKACSIACVIVGRECAGLPRWA